MSIKLFVGCMYAGKTTELIKEYKKYTKINKKCVCINYYLDDRYKSDDYDSYLYSHDMEKIKCLKSDKLFNIKLDELLDNDVILINEGQFFSDLYDFSMLLCETYDKIIIICGLDGDFNRTPFGDINRLFSVADEIHKLKAYCMECKDGTPALFSFRNKNKDNKEIIEIGNDYTPLCRKHYLKLTE